MMDRLHVPDWLFSLAAILAAMAVALYFRISLPYAAIFDGQWVKFSGVDSYYYMRLVDNLLANFPQLMKFDPYFIYPGGGAVGNVPVFFAYIVAGTIKLLGGAAPSQQTADTIAAFIPAVMGCLLVVPVFFIGRALANRWAGLIAALLLALMPGQLLGRTLLGATDHHVAELFFMSFFMLFFILAIQHGRRFTYDQLRKGQFPPASRHIPYSFIAGILLGLYLITWQGALMLVMIVFVYFVIQFISDHLRGFPTDYLSKMAITCFLIALLVFLPVSRDKMTLLALAAVMLMPVALNIISTVMSARAGQRGYFVAVVAVLLALGGLAAWLLFPGIFASVTGYLYSFFSWYRDPSVVAEMKPLFLRGDFFTLETAWSEFALALYTGLAGLGLLVYQCVKKGEPGHIFTAAWCVVWMFISFGMVRFTAYFAICLALMTGYLAGSIIYALWPRREQQAEIKPRKKAKKAAAQSRRLPAGRLAVLVTVALAVAASMVPCASNAAALARGNLSTPSNAWMEALTWLKKNTPEPLGNADDYYKLYTAPEAGKGFAYPGSSYSVAVWSDYGYWVSRIGHRIPVSNPGTWGLHGEHLYFSTADYNTAAEKMADWGAQYVIVDDIAASPIKFFAAAGRSGVKESDYYERCWQKQGDKYKLVLVIYPAYYRSIVSRLYHFDGRQITPASTRVMEYQEGQDSLGRKVKEITAVNNFNSYPEAEAFISGHEQGNYRIFGTDPVSSPVPLEALPDYHLVYQSAQQGKSGSAPVAAVKVFQYGP